MFEKILSFSEVRNDLGHSRLLQVVSSELETLPGSWLVDHWERPLDMHVKVMNLVDLTDEVGDEVLVEDNASENLLSALSHDLRFQK